MFRNLHVASTCILAAGLSLVAFVPVAGAKKIKSERALYSFCAQANCTDGAYPSAVIMDSSGNIYGTTAGGGNNDNANCYEGCGTVFKVAPDGNETVLYSFCAQANCIDGADPIAGLVMDGSGNLYGTTSQGGNAGCGAGGCGTVFEVAADGTETTLYSFCAEANCADGASPVAGLIVDGAGNLYGTTSIGGLRVGCDNGCGTVFQVAPGGTETVLHSFCPEANCNDGAQPQAGLIMDGSGNLYGTTSAGNQSDGTVFEIAPDGTETILHEFTGRSDGAIPLANVILDSIGNVYGTTDIGGSTCCEKHHGAGTVFELAPDGTQKQLYVFKKKAYGKYPSSGLIADGKGNLYTGVSSAGKHDGGVVLKITIDAAVKR